MAYTRESRKDYAETRAIELKETLAKAVEELEQSDNWKKYLKANSKFHKYSFNNIMLILAQFEDATNVASYKTWTTMGRSVMKGQKGITIMTPRPYKKRDEAGNPIVDAAGNEVKRMSFGTGSVFDISQTEITDLELWAHMTEGSSLVKILDMEVKDGSILDSLAKVAEAIGFKFILDDLEGRSETSNGYTTLGADVKEIHVRESLPLAQKIKTACHELGHALMHADEGETYSEDGRAHRGIAEIEAESVAFIVCDAFGMDTSEYSIGYLASWSKGNADMIRQIGESINKASKRIMHELDKLHGVVVEEEAE